MAHLVIKNIGPIKTVDIDMNKVNVFIGPQSSGKSTIAKIISYCAWVEKDVATHLSLDKYNEELTDGETLFFQTLTTFHKMKGYIQQESIVEYKSNVISLTATPSKTHIEWVDKYGYLRNKISYIPAERNMIILPEMEKVELENNNIRSFLFDWFRARKIHTGDSSLNIMSLPLSYYYDSKRGCRIKSDSGKYDISLDNASSGMQSLVPLVTMIEHLTHWIYTHDVELSYEEQEDRRKTDLLIYLEKMLKPFSGKEKLSHEEMKDVFVQIEKSLNKKDERTVTFGDDYLRIRKNLFTTSKTNMIIEEPEQNLFPETQRDLVYYILASFFNSGRNHELTITTHSPYILLAINNCMMGYMVKDKIEDSPLSKKSWLDPQFVSVWEIHNGELVSIQDDNTRIIGKHYFNRNMSSIQDEYYSMLRHFEF